VCGAHVDVGYFQATSVCRCKATILLSFYRKD